MSLISSKGSVMGLFVYVRNPPILSPSPLHGAWGLVENRAALLRVVALRPPPRRPFAPANDGDDPLQGRCAMGARRPPGTQSALADWVGPGALGGTGGSVHAS